MKRGAIITGVLLSYLFYGDAVSAYCPLPRYTITVAFHPRTPRNVHPGQVYSSASAEMGNPTLHCAGGHCCVSLEYDNVARDFGEGGDGDDQVTTLQQLNNIHNNNPGVQTKVVTFISIGGFVAYGSCCPTEGGVGEGYRNMVLTLYGVVNDEQVPTRSIVWAHEFGHALNLKHNDLCNGLLMNSQVNQHGTGATFMTECPTFTAEPDILGPGSCGCTPVGTSFAAVGGNSQVTLTWEEFSPTSAAFYHVYRSDRCWGPLELVGSVFGFDPQYTPDSTHYTFVDSGADYFRSYYYELHTWDGEVVSATATPTGLTPDFIGQPTNLSGYAINNGDGTGSVHLTWQPSQGGATTGYHVYRTEYTGMPDCSRIRSYLGVATTTSFVDTSAPTLGQPLFYRVRGFNSTIGSDISNEVQIASFPGKASGGYMYLDTNGNGTSDPGDMIAETGSTTVDIWLRTDRNRAGEFLTCSDGSGSSNTIRSYSVILKAVGGSVSWSNFVNRVPEFSVGFGESYTGTHYHNGYGALESKPAGTYRLASVTVTPVVGTPVLFIVDEYPGSAAFSTQYGSDCPGLDGDNTMKFKVDWFDVDGAGQLPVHVPSIPALAGSFLSWDTGPGPNGISVADLSADGRPDFVVANRNDNKVSVFVAESEGTYRSFRPRMDYVTGTEPRSVALAEFNGDGKLDVVTANYSANSVSVLLGVGDGSFGTKTDFSAGINPWTVATADFNGDGKRDIAVSNYSANTVSVLLGNGNGTFGAAVAYTTGQNPIGLVAVELLSGGVDLVVTNFSSNTVSVLPGNGNGTFGAKADYATGTAPYAVAAIPLGVGTNFNPDLAVANHGSGSVSIFMDNGAGGFGARTDYSCNSQPAALTVADFNGDGRRDIAVANSGSASSSVSVLVGNIQGTFGAPAQYQAAKGPQAIAASELNGDGRYDLIVGNFNANTVTALFGNGNGTFGSAVSSTSGQNEGPADLALGDINGDGKLDAAVAHTVGGVAVLMGNGSGAFGPPMDWAFEGNNYITLADLASDGDLDILVARTAADAVSVRRGNGDGTFTAVTSYSTGLLPRSLAVKDFNGDGYLDFATGTGSTVSVRLGLSDGSFGTLNQYFCASEARWVVAEEVTGDAFVDLVTANNGTANVSVLPGNGSGTFNTRIEYPCGSSPIALAVGDLNGDGSSDLVVVNGGGATVSVLLNTGSGFGAPSSMVTGSLPQRVALADMNGDGDLDIVTTNGTTNVDSPVHTVSVLLGAGDGTFTTRRDFGAGQNPLGLAIGNVDNRTLPDIVVTNNIILETVTALVNRASVTAVPERSPRIQPSILGQNYPNPFNPSTWIEVTLPKAGKARLRVFDIHGRLVVTLADGIFPQGRSSLSWDGTGERGQRVASGIYIYQLESDHGVSARRMVLAR